MSIVVSVLEYGSEIMYFKLTDIDDEVLIERPDSYAIKIPKRGDVATLVASALLTIKKEEDKWIAQKEAEVEVGGLFESLRT